MRGEAGSQQTGNVLRTSLFVLLLLFNVIKEQEGKRGRLLSSVINEPHRNKGPPDIQAGVNGEPELCLKSRYLKALRQLHSRTSGSGACTGAREEKETP